MTIIKYPLYEVAKTLIKKGETPEYLKKYNTVADLSDEEMYHLQNDVFGYAENRLTEWSTNISHIELLEEIVSDALSNGNINTVTS